ncbi:efflux RND transporter periplasmic adaptor subunit [Sphingobium yanoikuyae]|uniref:Efflux RND transporter periplasmic adaptor subunit n=1 Tax=Sphingobium yanoikuyae TaxID=13690 RepID=A0A3G2UKL6_SPHYA|nr:efflux RND transporter periplasmic adaptor subunit [Sphingobium yanoikuyae]AYO75727.1 efflux RND transporter periplasmic adaptor subunit [Sphingobium yanoikuyae]
MARFAHVAPIAVLLLAACNTEPPAQDERRAVTVQRVDAGRASEVSYAGEIRSAFESQIGFEVAGRIVERSVDPGSHVRAGQMLLRLDNADYARALDSAVAQSGSARTAAAVQQADLARSRALLQQGFISPAEFDQQKAAAVQAQAQLRAAAAQRGTASAQLGRTLLVAPRSGVITQIQAEVGQVVGAGQAVVTLADPAHPEIAVALPEGSLERIRGASRFSVALWSSPDRRYTATLRSIAGAADPTTRTFAARFAIAAPSQALRMGETAELRVEDPTAKAAVRVPLTAVLQANGQAQVWILDRRTMTVQPRAVQIASAQGDMLTILSGLRPGETIVTAGVHLLRAGETVRVVQVPQS